MIEIEPESPSDSAFIEPLLDAAFGPQRHKKTSYRYRDGVAPVSALSLVARAHGDFVGTIRYWPVLLGELTCLLLGPLAIAPDRQRQGVGRWLARDSLDLAEKMGYRLVFLVGDPDYYSRMGFGPAPAHIIMPGEDPNRLQYRTIGEFETTGLQGKILPWRPARSEGADEPKLRLVG